MTIINTASGKLLAITPGRRWADGEYHAAADWTVDTLPKGYAVVPEPTPKVPTPQEVAAAEAATAVMAAQAPDKLLARIEALEAKVAKLEKETPK